MAADKLKGITIEINGNVQPLTAAIKEATKASTGLNSELNSINRLLKNVDPGNIDLLKQKQTVLNTTIDDTKKKLKLLETAFAQATPEEVGEAQYRELERQIISTKDKLSSYESQLRETEDAISKVEKETGEAAEETKDFGEQAKKSGEETKKLSATSKVAFAAVGAAIAGAAAKLGSFLVDSVEASKELRGDLSKLEQNAKSAGMSLEDVSGSLEYLVGITDETDSSVEALSNLMAAGFKGQGLADAVETLSGAVLKFPDTIKIESLADSLQETLATGAATGQFAEVLDRCGISADDFSAELAKCTTQAEKQELALKTLSNAGLKKISQDYKAANADMLEYSAAQLRYEKSVANLGKAMQPAMTAWKNATAELNDALADVAQSADFERLIKKVSSALDSLVKKVLPGLIDALIFVVDNGDTVLAIIASIGAGMAGWKVGQWASTLISSFQALIAGVKGADAAQKGLNATMAANPIGLVLSAVAALIPLLASWVGQTKELSAETQALVDESKELSEATKENEETFQKTTAEINGQETAALKLVDRMREIKESSMTAEQKQRALANTGSQLKAIIPELADEVDNYTESTDKNSDALERAIKENAEYYREKARQEKLANINAAIGESEALVAGATEQRSQAEAELNRLLEEKQKILTNTQNSNSGLRPEETVKDIDAEIRQVRANIDALDQVIEETTGVIRENEEQLGLYEAGAKSLAATTGEISRATAEELIAIKESGKELTEEQQMQLDTWRAANEDTYAEIQQGNEEQRAALEERVGLTTNAYERINQGTKVSVQDMIKNLNANAEATEKWTQNMATLAGSNLDKGFLAELRAKGPEAGAQVQAMVDYMKKAGDKGFTDFNAALTRAADAGVKSMNAEFAGSDSTQGVSQMVQNNSNVISQDTSISSELVDKIAFAKGEATKAVSRQGFDSVGSSIVAHVAKGTTDASQKVYNAVNAMVSGIKKRINVNISTSSSGSSVRVQGFARGGILSREQIIRVAERGPEAVIPLDRLGGIVEGAMRRTALELPAGGYGETGRNAGIIKGSDNVQITVNVPISVSRSLSDADIQKKAGTISRVVGREFAKMTGGRMS